MVEHWSYDIHFLDVSESSSYVGDLLVECRTGKEALNIMRFCEKHGILTTLIPNVWWTHDDKD